MPEGRYAGIVLLVEGWEDARFMRAWLIKHLNVDHRNIRDNISPKGGGAAEQYVRERFPVEAALHRQNSAKRGSLLIAVIDADKKTFEERYNALIESINDRTGVFVFVPKRHMETWLRALNGFLPVDEDTDIKGKRLEHGDAWDAGLKFLELIRSATTKDLLPSLQSAVKEAKAMPREYKRHN